MITFRKLEVSNFRGIESATVDFTPRLNILYGTNELGKSTLLAAIRAVLLLPMSAREAQQYITWGTQHIPSVTLDFAVNNNEYRVHKQFAAGARAVAELYRMKGQEKFSMGSKNSVDKELRQLIAWGMPEPGSRGAPRGLPQSYLSNALLGYQDEVESILNTDINDDRSDSGTLALTEALGTIGQDPLVSDLLDKLGDSFTRVYTPTGQIKRTADSPLMIKTRDTGNAETRLRELQADMDESKEVEANLVALRKTAGQHLQEKNRLQELVDMATKAVAAYSLLNQSDDKQAEVESAKAQHKENQAALDSLQLDFSRAQEVSDAAQSEVQTTETNLARLQQDYKNFDQVSASDAAARSSAMEAEKAAIESRIKNLQTSLNLTATEQDLTRQSEEALKKRDLAQSALQQAERQVNLVQLFEKKQAHLIEVRELEEAQKTNQSMLAALSSAEIKYENIKQVVGQANLLGELRRELDKGITNDSTLSQTKHMRQEAQRQYNSSEEQLLKVNIETQDAQGRLQGIKQQLASLGGSRQTLVDSASTVIYSKRQLLQNTIAGSKQQINLAESAIHVQRDIQAHERHISDIESELAHSRRNLDHAVTNLTQGGRRQQRPRRGSVSSEGQQPRSSGDRVKPVVTLAVTVVATIALLAVWLSDLLPPIVVMIAPIASIFGLGLAAVQWKSSKKHIKSRPLRDRKPPEFGDSIAAARDQFGSSTDDLKREGDRLAAAENELAYLKDRYDNLIAQLGADSSTIIDQEQRRVDDATHELSQLDTRQAQEIEELDREIAELEQQSSVLNQFIQTQLTQQSRLAADFSAAQQDLANHEARIEHSIKAQTTDTGDIEFRLIELASVLQKRSDSPVDHSSIEAIEFFKGEQHKQLESLEQQFHNQRDLLAGSKSDVRHREGNQPLEKLKALETEIQNIVGTGDQPVNIGSIAEATRSLDTAKNTLNTAISNLNHIKGQLQSKRDDQSRLPVREDESSESVLVALQQQLVEKYSDIDNRSQVSPEEKTQLQKELTDLELKLEQAKKKRDQTKQKADELSLEVKAMHDKAGQSQGKLTELAAQVDDKAKQNAQVTIDKAIAESNGLINQNSPLLDQRELLQASYKAAAKQAADSNKELNQSRGKLELIGGSVLTDEVRRQSETVNRLQREATDFQKKCEAEKHLLDTLNKHNEEHSVHLGRKLAPSVSKKFSELTGSRYNGFSLAPTLSAKGVRADGVDREYTELSIGTRQQLAVLVKMALAAQLEACLVLDDQLVQSDTARLAWFREALRSSAHESKHQIIVITCRPEDYDAPFSGDDFDSSVDLAQRMKRVVYG